MVTGVILRMLAVGRLAFLPCDRSFYSDVLDYRISSGSQILGSCWAALTDISYWSLLKVSFSKLPIFILSYPRNTYSRKYTLDCSSGQEPINLLATKEVGRSGRYFGTSEQRPKWVKEVAGLGISGILNVCG